MTKAQNKAARLIQIENLLLAHPEGLTQAEIARRLGVARSTILRNLPDLPGHIYEENGHLKIDRTADLINVRLNLHEALAVHLASRLLATRMDRRNRHAAAALRKLGLAMERWAKRISVHVLQSADVMDDAAQRDDPVYLQVLETLTLAWAEQRKAHIWHQGEAGERVFEYLLSPYFIEPYAVGQTTHVIGLAQLLGEKGWSEEKMRTFKIERIRRAEVTRTPYEIPADFDPRDLLADAWGIWYSDGEPVEVVLRFHPKVARRVQETRWHRSEQKTLEADGSVIWRARVAEPLEMLPWIRGWGADCEVLAPESLRKTLEREARRLAEVYGIVMRPERKSQFYAHTKDGADESEWQPLIEHLTRVADYAAEFGRDAGVAELARVAGMLHDLGKYSKEFQARLRGAKIMVDHATAGAKEVIQLFKGTPQERIAMLLAYCISGHHTGLLDYGNPSDLPGNGTLTARLKTEVCDYSAYKSEVDLSALAFPKYLPIRPPEGKKEKMGFSLSFLTRMIYSALVDADFLETEEFMQGKKPRGGHEDIPTLRDKLNAYLRQFENPTSDINRKRTETLKACVEKAAQRPGFFKLTVPTGGGKTLASMAFALNHAAAHGMKRIIYVIPFTTIIEQNAGVFKEIFGEENVLEHHSSFDWEAKGRETAEQADDRTRSVYAKLKLAAENWDIPIIVTTNVQFFESLFANKPSRCRKLHNIAKSVIVFDEAQMFPRDYLRPAISAVWELVTNYGASAVFCTATQPNLERFLPAGTPVTELAPEPQKLFDFYKRVKIENLGTLTDDELIARLNAHKQVLCIVNTRRHASGLFRMLEGEGNYHLSTLMCPAHRRQKLAEIRQRLENGQVCRVISTTVMEAGIDVDFPVGYRALTGLDSINQAAGRVNREMKRGISEMFIFEPQSEFIKCTPRYISQAVEVARAVLRDHAEQPISIPAIEAYFDRLYSLQDPQAFDYKRIMECFEDSDGKFEFETAARKFQVIEGPTKTVIIPFNEEAKHLIEELKYAQYPSSILRKLQPYTVSIYQGEFEALSSKGVILTIAEEYAVLNPERFDEYYSPDTGILVPESGGGEGLFF
jgi:CRISPR-associated endonuclease/helicase Cas3